MTGATLPHPGTRTRARASLWLSASVWGLVLALVAVIGTLGAGLHRGDPEGAARLANAEIEAGLEPGERVEARVVVSQRLWWDYFRHTYGVLAATDRRLLYVGVPPEPFLHRDNGPPELVTQAFAYARGLAVQRGSRFRRQGPTVRVTASTGTSQFAVTSRDVPRLEAVIAVADRVQAALRSAADAERRATEAAEAAARRPIYHLVQRGEALEFIARRYGVSVESLSVWNGLTNSRITSGRRLLVRPGRTP
ncbi:MAG: LysM peptidoglycan-binding domain-containing protein [Gemmatimonadaceae bacterium]|nr:LysM peptidoglycan-binding domain-containing protein [Gemmatimonadaceae bacterium]